MTLTVLPNDGRKYTSAFYAQMKQLRGAICARALNQGLVKES